MKKMKVGTKINRIFEIFAGERVILMTKLMVSEKTASEVREVQKDTPLSIEGYLLDYDDKYYYLGHTDKEVTSAVAIPQILLIQQIGIEDPYSEFFDKADTGNMN